MKLLVGTGREIITPRVGGLLFGYRQDVVSESVRDDLTVTAAAFACGENRAVILSATVCLIHLGLADEIRALAGEAAGVPPENVILAATHTHSGPSVHHSVGWGVIDREYCDSIFIPQCVKAAKGAAASLKPARLGVNSGDSAAGVNRREVLRGGGITLGQNPWGVRDPSMTVMSFKGTDGAPLLNIVHYGAHCTAAGMNHEITRDWAGIMTDRLGVVSGAPTMFINGAEGDTGPRLSNGRTVGDLGYMTEIGSLAALDAVRIYKGIHTYDDAGCAVVSGEIRIARMPLMPLAEAEAMFAGFGEKPPHNIDLARYSTLREIIAMHKNGGGAAGDFTLRQTIVRVGGAVFVPLPFEVFSEISLRLRAFGGYPHVLIMSNANGSFGYLPTQDQLCRGGYETEMFRWCEPYRLPDDTDTRMVLENLRIMEGLK